MAEFNAMDTAAFKGVWVFCEQREGQVQAISYQLLSEGRKLANDLGVELCGVVMGSEVNEDYLKALGGYGADRVYYIDSPLLKDYTTDGYAKVLCDLIMEKKPTPDVTGVSETVEYRNQNDSTYTPATNAIVKVLNKAGTQLPSTGGIGTTLFYVVGGGLMVAAIVLLVTKKRMENK